MAKDQTTFLETVKVDKNMTTKKLSDKLGRPLGSPINGKDVGQTFDVTLTGEIQISEFNGRKSAHFLTKEGYRLAVNAAFNPTTHTEGKVFKAICRESEINRNGEMVKIKFSAFAE